MFQGSVGGLLDRLKIKRLSLKLLFQGSVGGLLDRLWTIPTNALRMFQGSVGGLLDRLKARTIGLGDAVPRLCRRLT